MKRFTNVDDRTLNFGKRAGKMFYFKPNETKEVSDELISVWNDRLTNAVLHNQLKVEDVKVSKSNDKLETVKEASSKKTVKSTKKVAKKTTTKE